MEAPIIIIVITIGYFIYYSIKQNKKPSQNSFQKQKSIKNNIQKHNEKVLHRLEQDKNKVIKNLKEVINTNENFKNLKVDDILFVKDFIANNKIKLDDDKILIFLKIDDFIKKIINETKSEINFIIGDFKINKETKTINDYFNYLEKTSVINDKSEDSLAIKIGFVKYKGAFEILEEKINFYNENGNKLLQALEEKIITIKYYNSLSFVMLSYLNEDEKLKFFEYYNLFEKLGVFDSTWQNKIYNKLSSIDNNLHKINENLKILNDNIKDISIEINELKENLNSKLSDIKSSADINNIISGIQLYQLYKINKQTKN